MHNCKANRETLIALALNEPDQTQPLPAELEACAACREEYAALRNVLRVADQAKQTALPAESFWPGYHHRLRQSLAAGSNSGTSSLAFANRTSLGSLLKNFVMASVRLPVPVAAALLVFLGVSVVFALNARRSVSATPPIVVTKTVEVQVPQETIREKVVTRVVYRDRNLRQPLSAKANSQRNKSAAEAPISLVGFKPTNDIKLTIIKGSYHDEK